MKKQQWVKHCRGSMREEKRIRDNETLTCVDQAENGKLILLKKRKK